MPPEVAPMKACPDCLSEIPREAPFCRHCGERVEGRRCTACGARNWDEATLCRWCGSRLEAEVDPVELEPFTVAARRLPTFLQRGRFLPQVMELSREKIVVSTPGPFGLSEREEEIPWSKVAGFDYRSGIFWDQVTIETRGQASTTVPALGKADGQRIRQVLRELEA
jgi:ribosomal protein L40E